MRSSLCFATLGFAAALAARGGTGVPPRPTSSDYPVHQAAGNATIAATLVPPDLAKRIFPADVNKNYFVVEVAIYPQDGQTVYIDSFDFDLQRRSCGARPARSASSASRRSTRGGGPGGSSRLARRSGRPAGRGLSLFPADFQKGQEGGDGVAVS